MVGKLGNNYAVFNDVMTGSAVLHSQTLTGNSLAMRKYSQCSAWSLIKQAVCMDRITSNENTLRADSVYSADHM